MSLRAFVWIALSAIVLGGCVETRFESPLGGRQESCDARWKGLWIGPDPADQSAAVFVDGACHVFVIDKPAPDKPVRRVELPVRYRHVEGRDYLSVEAAAFKELADLDPPYAIEPAPAHAYFFARYAISGDRLEIDMVNSKRVAQLVIDDKIDGTVGKSTNGLHVFVRGDPARMLEIVRNEPIFDGVTPTILVRSKQSADAFERNLERATAKQPK
jgi:hypothetical protein